MNVGEYIKHLRIEKGLSQEELGKIIGVQRAAVQKWESGKTQNLKRMTIKKLSEYFCVSPVNFVSSHLIENNTKAITLTDDEKAIISKYNQLNKEGRKKTNEYINDLLESPKYTNSSESEAVEENEILFEAARKKHSDVEIECNNIDL